MAALGLAEVSSASRLEDAMDLSAYRINSEPFYQPLGDEIEVYQAAYAERLPVMLKGPTGCGKTRFVEHMAWRLGNPDHRRSP